MTDKGNAVRNLFKFKIELQIAPSCHVELCGVLYQAECKACCSVARATLLPAETHNKMFLLLTNINPECTQPPPPTESRNL